VGLYEIGASNKKLSDMQKRKEIINTHKPDLVISIHQNYFQSSSVSGAHVFYSDKQEKSEQYAKLFQQDLNVSLGQSKEHKKADYYVLQCSVYPSLLIECGFLSNPTDEKNLLTPSYREKIADVIASSVDKIFFSQTDSEVT
jgi:N-acetylmuramoyl-L-alanine amidase